MRKSVQEELNTSKTEVAFLQKRVKEDRNGWLGCEKDRRQLREQLKHLNPKCSPPQDMSYYSLKPKEELIEVIAAQKIQLSETVSSGPKPHNSNTDPDPDNIQELQGVISSLQHQLQAERTRAENLYKEREEFRYVLLDIASQDVKQVEKLEKDKRSLEQEVKVLQEKVLGQGPEEESKDAANIKELLDLVFSQNDQLQTETLRADRLQADLEEVRHQLQAKANTELKLTTQNETLKQEIENLQKEALNKEVIIGEQQEKKTNQLQEMSSSCLELASKLKHQEEVSQAPSLPMDITQEDTEEDIQEDTQDTDQETSGTTPEMVQESSEMERVSLWRRFKKCLTPNSRRQYKQQRWQSQDHQRQHTPGL
ncbi:golgin subfamily A member 5-like [Notolabrus celidotus]|uniref:golgin subfamily A member 5-like n=1 Tax=Notolabrus celidotus TaxID=1203425 RepID=UPI00149057B5|nr:golgin subfamily A member 5-like [Notolabrus celidotus]